MLQNDLDHCIYTLDSALFLTLDKKHHHYFCINKIINFVTGQCKQTMEVCMLDWNAESGKATVRTETIDEATDDNLYDLLQRNNVYRDDCGLYDYTLDVMDEPDRRLKMYYTNYRNNVASSLNVPALRILLDRFALEPLPTPVDLHRICDTCPFGTVCFYMTDKASKQLFGISAVDLKARWHALFRQNVPYVQLHHDYNKAPQFYMHMYNQLSSIESAQTLLHRIIQHYNREHPTLTCTRVDRAYLTVLGAFFYAFYSHSTDWNNLNNQRVCWAAL
jgi:hypothetical protein